MHGHKQVTKLFWGLASYLQGHPPHRLLLTISDVCWQLCKEPDAEQAASECSLSFPSLQPLLLLIWKMGIRQGNKLDLLQLQHLAKKQILFIHHPVYLALIHLDRDLTMNTQAREGPSRPDTRVPCSQVHRTGGSTRCLHFLSASLPFGELPLRQHPEYKISSSSTKCSFPIYLMVTTHPCCKKF